MSSLKDIGQLIRVPIDQVELTNEYAMPSYQVAALSEKLQEPGLRNWVPVIVQEPTLRQYRVVSNGHILDAMKAAGQDYVWVAVVPDDAQVEEQVNLITGQLPLRINVCTANYEMILEALRHLRETPGSKLEKLNITLVAERIFKDPVRCAWASLQPLTRLGFKEVTSAKLKAFEEVFEAKPQPIEIRPVALNTASEGELLEILQAATTLPEVNLAKVDLGKLAHSISVESSRKYWRDLSPLTKIKPGLTKSQLAGLDMVFTLEPAAIQPVVLNTASEEELLEVLQAASALPKVTITTANLKQLAHSIAIDSERKYWKDLKALTKIKPALKPSQLKGLDEVFTLEPVPAPEPNTVPYLLDAMSSAQLKKEAQKRGLSVSKTVSKPELVEMLSKQG
ncbi:hypothetical protein [Pantanalinema sp. GBBB05]|uniref:hypothetical protein n=1 Tax=Pantanalinema sp. GBBB05 TaxID=2604139 RepID=UPI001D9C0812|nr:hypothetical protein [Pantanalinema sp. GBBB05]